MTAYGKTELYRLFDGDTLLYIGISRSYRQHRKADHTRRYGKQIAEHPIIETFDLRFEAELAEVVAQYLEQPRDGRYPSTLWEVYNEIDSITFRYAEHPERLVNDLDGSPTHILAELLT